MLIFLVVVCIVFGGILFVIFAAFLNDDDGGSRFSLGGDGLPRAGWGRQPPGAQDRPRLQHEVPVQFRVVVFQDDEARHV